MVTAVIDQLETFGPVHCKKLDYHQACQYTKQLASSHYENFTVVSWLLPKRLRQDFRHVYAFCRWADDLGDETGGDTQRSIELLQWWSSEVDLCYAGKPRHPVFVALSRTIEKHAIPRKPFDDLIDAFVQDQTVLRYDTWEQVCDYCSRSANPVGHLVLYLCGYRDAQRQQLADCTCTALQLANFWQDTRRDVLERNRVYIPEQIARQHQLDIDLMVQVIDASQQGGPGGAGCGSSCGCLQVGNQPKPTAGEHAILPAYQATIGDLVKRTWPLFKQGQGLWPMLPSDIRVNIHLFSLGGQAILHLIEKQNYNTLQTRPSLGKGAKLALMMRAVVGKVFRR